MFGFSKRRKHARFSPEVELRLTEVERLLFGYRSHGASNNTETSPS